MDQGARQLDRVQPVEGFEAIIQAVPLDGFHSVLDVGLGAGAAAEFFADHGKAVTAIGLNIAEYDLRPGLRAKIELIECDLFSRELAGRKFDAVWFSHCLEHIANPGLALDRVRELLEEEGWLFISVPPFSPFVQDGHVITGWNVGQLMYFLLLHGFNVRDGHFVTHGYNVTAFVRKATKSLPPLKHDRGDIEALSTFFPSAINAVNAFNGDLPAVNWIGFKDPELNERLRRLSNPAAAHQRPLFLRALGSILRLLKPWLRPLFERLRALAE